MIPSGRELGNVPGSCRRFQDASPAAGRSRQGQQTWLCCGPRRLVPLHASSPSCIIPLVLLQPFASLWGELPRLRSSHLENTVGFRPGCSLLCPCWWCRGLLSTKPPPQSRRGVLLAAPSGVLAAREVCINHPDPPEGCNQGLGRAGYGSAVGSAPLPPLVPLHGRVQGQAKQTRQGAAARSCS